MAGTGSGAKAELAVAEKLQQMGYKILDHNWKTRFCEIDIVAEKDQTVYLVEVKYRRQPDQGSGFDYILPCKLKQMAKAADAWVQAHYWRGSYQLLAAAVSGDDSLNIELVELF